MRLDSNKGRYDFSAFHPPGTAGMSCVLVWTVDRWVTEKSEDFVLAAAPEGMMKLTCAF